MSILEIENISKSYGSVSALKNVSLSIEKGSIFALLGPNGAGKSTLVKIILGLVKAQSGDILFEGAKGNSDRIRNNISFLPEKFTFFPYYTVSGVLRFYGTMYGVDGEQLAKRVEESLGMVHINELENRKLKTLSKGQLQRVGIACLLVGQKEILILDEPFSGLDPIGIKELRDLLKELKEDGKTIFLNSHILSEMELVCDHFAILNKGECLKFGEVQSILAGEKLEDYFYNLIKKNE